MDKYSVYVGMDVHARSVTAQALDRRTGETCKKRFFEDYDSYQIASWIKGLGESAYCAYESGCTGIWLARDLRALGIDCDVIAISSLARSDKDKKKKCDSHDAFAILREISNPIKTYTKVFIPTIAQEGLREQSRLYSLIRDDAKRAKQNVTSYLLRHGRVWNEKTRSGNRKKPSGRSYDAWISSISFDDASLDHVFKKLVLRMKDAEGALATVKREMNRLATFPENAPYVDAFCCLKGIDVLTALTIKAEFCSFSRFSSGRKVSAWLGAVPSNRSSGEREVHGRITHSGNKYLRRALVEAVGSISIWKSSSKQTVHKDNVCARIACIASQANKRLFERYHHLIDEGKTTNKAKIAVVRELVKWCWVIGCAIEGKQGG